MANGHELESESEMARVPVSLRFLRVPYRIGRKIYRLVQAFSTVAVGAAGVFVQTYGLGDVINYVKQIFADSQKLALIVACTTIAFLLLKSALSGPKGFSAPRDLNDGDTH